MVDIPIQQNSRKQTVFLNYADTKLINNSLSHTIRVVKPEVDFYRKDAHSKLDVEDPKVTKHESSIGRPLAL